MSNKQKFLVSTKVLIEYNNKFLILLRSETAPTFPLHWDLPGGLVDKGSSPDQAIEREIGEETGLKVGNISLIGSTQFMRGEDPTIVLIYKAQASNDKVTISYEHSEFQWIMLEELKDIKMQPWLKDYLIGQTLIT